MNFVFTEMSAFHSHPSKKASDTLKRMTVRYRLSFGILVPLIATLTGSRAFAFSKAGNVFSTDGSQADVIAAVQAAPLGSTVLVPAGLFTWGESGASVHLDKPVILAGAGQSRTTILLSPTGPTQSSGVIRITGAATVRSLTVQAPSSGNKTTPFSTGGLNGWRITDVKYVAAGSYSYFVYVSSYGLIDNCTVIGGGGSNELIFMRGPTDSWQTPSSCGTVDALYVEDCLFDGEGYVCDINANGRAVFRYNVIGSGGSSGAMKVDGHGVASNTPARGVRHLEVYGNTWTSTYKYWNAIEIRGGSGYVFDNLNTNLASDQHGRIRLTDYAYTAQWTNFGGNYQTLADYPVKDQIGVGTDPKVAGSEPLYLWHNRRGEVNWNHSFASIPSAAIDAYRDIVGDPGAIYTMEDLIRADFDYFAQNTDRSFTGDSGVGRGLRAEMLAMSPVKSGVGFWVTDEAEWNSLHPGPDGCLYAWDGRNWRPKYTPFMYPHPLRSTEAAEGPPDAPDELTISSPE